MRRQPQIIAHADSDPIVITVITIVALVLLIGTWSFWYFFMDYRRKQLQLRSERVIDLELDTLLNSMANSPNPTNAVSEEPEESETFSSAHQKVGSASSRSNSCSTSNSNSISPTVKKFNANLLSVNSVASDYVPLPATDVDPNNDDNKQTNARKSNGVGAASLLSSVKEEAEDEEEGTSELLTTTAVVCKPLDIRRLIQANRQELREHKQRLREKHADNISKDCVIRTSFVCTICSTTVLIALAVVIGILFPHKPDYNLCNQQADWWAIWSSLEHGSIQTKYNTLLSIKNDNYFSVELRNTGARFYYQNSLIGYWYPNTTFEIPSHSITDIMALVTFAPGLTQAYTLYKLFDTNNLHLEIEFFADVSAFLFDSRNVKILGMHVYIQLQDFLVGKDIATNRNYCSCPHD
jgi:hypothetical protein